MWALWSGVQWWEEWQLRVLVLGSLSLQFVLFVGSMMRHARCLKSCMWLAYICADALAIYALTTLFNRHRLPAAATACAGGGDSDRSSSALEVLWAPVLLLHLGGHHNFTAYSIEDNELWGRHIVTLVSQVTVALYVFCRSWPGGGDRRLLQAAVLMFIAGILKFAQKPWSLRAASFNSLMTSSAVYPHRRRRAAPMSCMFYISGLTFGSIRDAAQLRDEEDSDISLQEYVHYARGLVLAAEAAGPADTSTSTAKEMRPVMEKQFVDMSDPYRRRLIDMAALLKLERLRGLDLTLQSKLDFSFQMIYTNFKTVMGVPGLLLKLLLPFMSLAAAVLFDQSHKHGYKEHDVRVTHALLWCTTALGFLAIFLCPFLFSDSWGISAAQQSVLSFAARRSKPTRLMRVSGIVGLKDYVNQHWYIKHEPALAVITSVSQHVRDGWKHYIVDAASYMRFNNLRGQWAMARHKVSDVWLLWSLQLRFDHSVLVWHVATELCLHHLQEETPSSSSSDARRCSEVISNYMIYLLLIRPEMLLPGTRQGLFTTAGDDVEAMLEHDAAAGVPAAPPLDGAAATSSRDDVARRVLRAAQSSTLDARSVGPWILRACKVAEALMAAPAGGGEEERWLMVQGVWVEMLCYSASRCRGYLHAKSMGQGVEFLSYVWILWAQMGMETFADKFQTHQPAQWGEEIVGVMQATQASEQPQQRPAEEQVATAAV